MLAAKFYKGCSCRVGGGGVRGVGGWRKCFVLVFREVEFAILRARFVWEA